MLVSVVHRAVVSPIPCNQHLQRLFKISHLWESKTSGHSCASRPSWLSGTWKVWLYWLLKLVAVRTSESGHCLASNPFQKAAVQFRASIMLLKQMSSFGLHDFKKSKCPIVAIIWPCVARAQKGRELVWVFERALATKRIPFFISRSRVLQVKQDRVLQVWLWVVREEEDFISPKEG